MPLRTSHTCQGAARGATFSRTQVQRSNSMTEFFNRQSEKLKRRKLRNSMPKAEVFLWTRLKRRQLLGCKFRRQFSVGPYVIDFYSPEIRLGIELDGDSHFQPGARDSDAARDAFIESFGIMLLRFLNSDVYDNLDGVIEAVGRAILERRLASQPPLTPPSQGGDAFTHTRDATHASSIPAETAN